MSIKSILSLAAFCLALALVSWAAFSRLGVGDTESVAKGLAGIGGGFFMLTAVELALTGHMRRRNPGYLIPVLIGAKSVKLLLALLAIAVYGLLDAPGFLAFALNVVVFYVATLSYATLFNLRKNKL